MTTSRVPFASTALALALSMAPRASGQNAPLGGGRVSAEYARAAETLLGAVFPGVQRDWSDDSLVWPDGRREAFRLGGFTRLRVGDTWWLAGALDFPARLDGAARALKAGKGLSEAVRSRIVVVKAGADWRVLDQRVVDVDPDSPVSAVDHIELSPPADRRWPRLEVRGVSAGQSGGVATMVWWLGELDAETSAWTRRVPAEYWRRGADGAEVQELLQPQVSGDTLELVGVQSGARFSFACPGGACKVRALSLFERPPVR